MRFVICICLFILSCTASDKIESIEVTGVGESAQHYLKMESLINRGIEKLTQVELQTLRNEVQSKKLNQHDEDKLKKLIASKVRVDSRVGGVRYELLKIQEQFLSGFALVENIRYQAYYLLGLGEYEKAMERMNCELSQWKVHEKVFCYYGKFRCATAGFNFQKLEEFYNQFVQNITPKEVETLTGKSKAFYLRVHSMTLLSLGRLRESKVFYNKAKQYSFNENEIMFSWLYLWQLIINGADEEDFLNKYKQVSRKSANQLKRPNNEGYHAFIGGIYYLSRGNYNKSLVYSKKSLDIYNKLKGAERYFRTYVEVALFHVYALKLSGNKQYEARGILASVKKLILTRKENKGLLKFFIYFEKINNNEKMGIGELAEVIGESSLQIELLKKLKSVTLHR